MCLRFEALFVGFFCVVLGDCSGGCCVVCCSLAWFWFWVVAVGFWWWVDVVMLRVFYFAGFLVLMWLCLLRCRCDSLGVRVWFGVLSLFWVVGWLMGMRFTLFCFDVLRVACFLIWVL